MGFDAAELALKSVCPSNVMKYDDKEMPSIFVRIPKFRLCDVLSTASTNVHPAFRRNGVEVDEILIGKFQTHHYNGRAYSLPGEDPSAYAGLDTFVATTVQRAAGSMRSPRQNGRRWRCGAIRTGVSLTAITTTARTAERACIRQSRPRQEIPTTESRELLPAPAL